MEKIENIIFNPTGALKALQTFNNSLEEYFFEKNEKVLYINCNHYQDKVCHVKENYNFTYNSNQISHTLICAACTKKSRNFEIKSSNRIIWIDDFHNHTVKELMSQVTQKNFNDFNYSGVNFGKIATYDLIVKYKLQDIKTIQNYWNEYKLLLENSVKTFIKICEIIENLESKRFFVFNSLYAVNRAAVEAAKRKRLKCYSINKGYNVTERENSFIITNSDDHPLLLHKNNDWKSKSDIQSSLIQQHLSQKMYGLDSHNYSQPKKNLNFHDLKIRLNYDKDFKKTCLVLLSSEDEYFATNIVGYYKQKSTNVFTNQLVWLEHLKDLSRKFSDTLFIIRIHPREFSNPRQKNISTNVKDVMSLFSEASDNIRINVPEQALSVYDLIEHVDFVLNMSSSVGVEVALLKTPILGFATERLVAYPWDIHKVSNTLTEYEKDLQDYINLSEQKKFDITDHQFVMASKWLSYLFEERAIRLTSNNNFKESISYVKIIRSIPTPIKKVLNIIFFFFTSPLRLRLDKRNRDKLDSFLND